MASGLIFLCIIAIAVHCTAQEKQTGDPPALVPSGEPLPEIRDLDGKAYDLVKDDGSRVLVLLFVRTDCPISNRYAPEVGRLHKKFQAEAVRFLLVYVDPDETADSMRAHLKEYNFPCGGLFDPKHVLAKYFGATVTPEAVVLNKDRTPMYRGRIDDLYIDFGKARTEPTHHDLEAAIEDTLRGRPIAEPVTKAVGCYISDLE